MIKQGLVTDIVGLALIVSVLTFNRLLERSKRRMASDISKIDKGGKES